MKALCSLALLLGLVQASASHAQCTVSETFTGDFDSAWMLTDEFAVGIDNDVLRVAFISSTPQTFHGAVLDACTYSDFEINVRMRDLQGTRGKAVAFRMRQDFMGYNVNVRGAPFHDLVLGKGPFATAAIAALGSYPHDSGQWLNVRVRAEGPRIQVYVDGVLVIDFIDSEPLLSGWAFLGINAGGSLVADAEFDDFTIVEIEPAIATAKESLGAVKSRY